MTVIASVSRGMRFGNEGYITGVDTLIGSNGQQINDELLANTDDQAITVLPTLKSQIDAMLFKANYAMVLHLRHDEPWAVTAFTAVGGDGEFTVTAADMTAFIKPGDEVMIEGHGGATPANNGAAMVVLTAFAAGVNTFTVLRERGVYVAEAGVTTEIRKFIHETIEYPITAFTVAGPPGVITTNVDLTDVLAVGDEIVIKNATDPLDDGIYTVTVLLWAAPLMTITVAEATQGGGADVVPTIARCRTHLRIQLAADVPFLWAGGSILNPLLTDITTPTADVPGGIAAELMGRIVVS